MRAMSMPQAPGEIIGPADHSPSVTQQHHESLNAQPDAQTLETASSPWTQRPASTEIVEDTFAPLDEVSLPIKPKSARRKKAESDSHPPASAEPSTKRRGRKKVESESARVIKAQPEIIKEPPARIETVPQVDPQSQIEESVAPVAFVSASEPSVAGTADSNGRQTPGDPVSKEEVHLQEDTQKPDISDNLWQTWLNRLGSVIS